jgi:predicted methyltransferase
MLKSLSAAAVALSLALGAGPPALAQMAGPPADAMTDPALKREAVLAFMGVKPGDHVADLLAGRFVRAFSGAVGPAGKVYAYAPDELTKTHPKVLEALGGAVAMAPNKNVEIIGGPINAPALPKDLDAAFIRQNYHDLHDKFMGPADVPAVNRAVYAALKHGGVYVVLDHAAAKGSGLSATETLHRIDRDEVVKEVTAAGFKLDGESDALANPADPRDKNVFDPSIRGKTDQFLLRFKKP